MKQRKRKFKIYLFLLGLVIIIVVVVSLFFKSKQINISVQKSYQVGGDMVTEHKSATSGGEQICSYSVTYQGKVIKLGQYSHKGICGISQNVTVSNGMIVVISGAYIYMYAPKMNRIIMLDPYALKSFVDFSKTHTIDLFADYLSKRFFLNGDSWQVEYDNTAANTTSDAPKKLVFTTIDNGKTFAFDPSAQQ